MNAAEANHTARAQARARTRQLQRALYRAAKASPTRRFHALYDKISDLDILQSAWEAVRANRGAPGIDGETIQAIEEQGVPTFLADLQRELQQGRYHPAPARRVDIPKASGGVRHLDIPRVRDRIVEQAAHMVLLPIFEADFLPCSYGFRPKRSAHQALARIRDLANHGHERVIDADIQDCFGAIDHGKLLRVIEQRISDRRVLKLLRKWLEAGVMVDGEIMPSTGTAQGNPISPSLANAFLHCLDRLWVKGGSRLGELVRYCDDLVILCRTEGQAREAHRQLEMMLEQLGLHLNPQKTRIVRLAKGQEGFDFLGFHHRKQGSWRWPGHWYLYRGPSQKAMQAIRSRVKELVTPRYLGVAVETLAKQLTPVLRGWAAYFSRSTSSFSSATSLTDITSASVYDPPFVPIRTNPFHCGDLSWYARPMRKAKDPDLPDALRRTLDRLGRKTLAAVTRYAASRLGAMGGVEGGKKRWAGTTHAQRQEAARKAVMVRWAKAKGRWRNS